MDAMVDKILECASQEPMIPLKKDDNVNVAEDDDSECSVDPDPAIIPPTSRTVTESYIKMTKTVILKMTKRAVTYKDGITEIVQETEISHSDTIPAKDLDVFKFATDVLSDIPEHFQNYRNVKIVKLNN